jgi:putative multiple sugar transport system substrate-binding protein
MKHTKVAMVVVLIVLMSATVFAGGKGEGKGPFVGIAMPETHVERWVQDGANLKAYAIEKGFVAEVSFGDADQSKQNKQIEDFITKGAEVLIVGSVNEGVATAVEKARDEGVIVVAYDRLITNSDAYDYYVTFDNFLVGKAQGEALARAIGLDQGEDGKVMVLFAGAVTDNNAFVFFDGAMSILRPYVESGALTLVGPAPLSSQDDAFSEITTENWQANVAKTRMENLLNSAASDVVLDAVLAPNDTLARAIIEALITDVKYSSQLPAVSGQDGEVASIKLIRDGQQTMTVFKDTRHLAKIAVELAAKLLQAKSDGVDVGDIVLSGAALNTTDYDTGKKVVKAYLADISIVTKDNYKEVLIDSGYYTADQLK